ncbi:MAG: methyltransferase domain-containing protein [Bacteroidetes bacterium]|nr:methyltransferase domain-containing protein [Bacteroidota bacterium]
MKDLILKLLKALGIYSILHKAYRKYLEKKMENEFPLKRQQIINHYNDNFKCLNIGGGNFLKENWRVLDYISPQYLYNKDFIDYNINLLELKQWPIQDNSFNYIYSSHCLEHLTNEAGLNTFMEAYRILKPKGVFRLTLPDIDTAYNAYKNNDLNFFIENVNAKDASSLLSYFLDFFTNIASSKIDKSLFVNDFRTLTQEDFLSKYIPKIIDLSTHDFSKHINWFNFDKIKMFGNQSGFKEIILSKRGESVSEEMRTPQFDHKPGNYCIYVDLIK